MVLPGFRDGTGLDDLYACLYKYSALYFLSSGLITGGGGKFFRLIPAILIGQWVKKIARGIIFCWTKRGQGLKLSLLVWIGFQRFVCFIQKSSDLGINLIIGMFLK